MKIETRHIGKFGHYPSKLIELTVSSNGASITEDITDLNGLVDEGFIEDLQNLVDELKHHNKEKE